MNMSEKCKSHVDSCRFCWMCHHVCPIGNATGQERNTARARALGISLVNREAIDISEIMDNIYECATCGACVHDCVTGWDPVMFTKETRLLAALEDKLPVYINTLLDNVFEYGNPYGKKNIDETLLSAIAAHNKKTDTLFFLGTDARYMVADLAVKAIKVMEKTGAEFTVLENEPASGAQADFLIGAAEETKEIMQKAAKALNEYKMVVVYDPDDSKAIMQLYKEYGVEVSAKVVTYTSYIADAIEGGALKGEKGKKTVAIQDPYQLSRDLGEIKPLRTIVSAYANVKELLLNGTETVWAGNILMAQYLPDVIEKVAERRIFNAKSVNAKILVTASPAEYTSLKAIKEDVEIIPIEDLILG